MRNSRVIPALHRAVLVALALPACGTTIQSVVDASSDAGDEPSNDAASDVTGDEADAADEDAGIEIPDVGPPEGCVIVGKPDTGVVCYLEMLPDPITCGVDVDADQQEASVCSQLCRPLETTCYFYNLGDGGTLTCGFCNPGRLNDAAREGMGPRCYEPSPDVGAYLARAAYLEGASVASFRILERELEAHAAPDALVRGARRAAADEVRHARAMRVLARERGAVARRLRRAPRRERGLLAFAIDNAVEGCVRETFSAALAMWQSLRATDQRIRESMAPIARDEARHAELAWRVAAWIDTRLDAAQRSAVRAARARAVRELGRSLEIAADSAPLGLPGRSQAVALFDSLRDSLWS